MQSTAAELSVTLRGEDQHNTTSTWDYTILNPIPIWSRECHKTIKIRLHCLTTERKSFCFLPLMAISLADFTIQRPHLFHLGSYIFYFDSTGEARLYSCCRGMRNSQRNESKPFSQSALIVLDLP